MKRLSTSFSLFAVTVLAGCSDQAPVTLTSASQVIDKSTVSVTPAVGGKKIYLTPLQDNRPEKQDIGWIYNGSFTSTNVVLTNSAAEVTTETVRQKLEQAGYTVEMAEPDQVRDDAPLLTGEVVALACCDQTFASGAVSTMSIDATVTDKDRKILDSTYAGEGSRRATFFYGPDEFQGAMTDALDSAVQKLIDDVEAQGL